VKKILVISLIAVIAVGCCACGTSDREIPAQPIPNDDFYTLVTDDMLFIRNPDYPEGYSNPIAHLSIPQNPFMAPNGRSNMHNDAYMTYAY